MKSLLLSTGLALFTAFTFAQANNPFNQKGIDYVASLVRIQNDYKAGNAKNFSEETLKYYSKSLPLQTQVSVDVASSIINTRNNGNLDFSSFIGKSSLSDLSKKTLTETIFGAKTRTDESYKANITAKIDVIQNSNISAGEKELVLSLMAISYNVARSGSNIYGLSQISAMQNVRNRGCWISGPYGEGPGSDAQCIAAGALVGGIIGWSICGFWCALGGAIIGGVVGGLS